VDSFELILAISIVCGLLINFHSGISDDVLLLVVFVAVTGHYVSAGMQSLTALLLTPIPWFMVLAGPPYNTVVPAALLLLMGFFCTLRPGAVPSRALRSDNAH